MKKRTTNKVLNETDYKIIRALYYLNKGEHKVARLPINDARRIKVRTINKQVNNSFRKALSRIAAIW
jgi:hypothetical protein